MDFPIARQRFYHEIHQPDDQIHLARAALYLAQEEYPSLDPDEYLNALETMAAEVKERLPSEFYPLRMIQIINRYLFEDLGFCGNTTDYYDPCNSYLNQVIDRRTGIPITLSLIYLEIAKHVDLPMVGIGMPGHFLIRPTVGDMQIFVDPFHQGEIMFAEDCQQRLRQVYGVPVDLRPEFLQPVSHHQFLARILGNLKGVYVQQNDLERALAVVERLLLLFPDAPLEQRDRGLLYYQLGRWTEAKQDLEQYLEQMPTADDAPLMRELLQRMNNGF